MSYKCQVAPDSQKPQVLLRIDRITLNDDHWRSLLMTFTRFKVMQIYTDVQENQLSIELLLLCAGRHSLSARHSPLIEAGAFLGESFSHEFHFAHVPLSDQSP